MCANCRLPKVQSNTQASHLSVAALCDDDSDSRSAPGLLHWRDSQRAHNGAVHLAAARNLFQICARWLLVTGDHILLCQARRGVLHPLRPDACKASHPLRINGALPRSASKSAHVSCMLHATRDSFVRPEEGCCTLLRCVHTFTSSAHGLRPIFVEDCSAPCIQACCAGMNPGVPTSGGAPGGICKEVTQRASYRLSPSFVTKMSPVEATSSRPTVNRRGGTALGC
jgi:hypothetical protein